MDKALTAFVSVYTAMQLPELVPRVLALSRPADLRDANVKLQAEIAERQGTEKALRLSESRFRLLLQDLHVGVVVHSPTGEVLLSNNKALELLGVTEDQLLGSSSLDPRWNVVHEDGSPFPGETHPVAVVLSTGMPVREVAMGVLQPQSGDRIWLLVSAEPRHDAAGAVTQVIVTFTDITARYQAQAEVKAQRAFLDQLIEIVPSAIFVKDGDGRLLIANHAHEIAYRMPSRELIGQSCHQFTHYWPDHVLSAFSATHAQVMQTRQLLRELQHIPQTDGSFRWYQTVISPWLDADDNVKGIIGNAVDVTELKLAEETLKQQSEHVRLLGFIVQRIRHSLNLNEVLQAAVVEVRHLLETDRVLIYQFHPDWSGTVISESVEDPNLTLMGQMIHGSCFEDDAMGRYQRGQITIVHDVPGSVLAPGYAKMLAQFGVQANLVVPVLVGDRLWGLLIAHSCQAPRQWKEWECQLLQEIALQLGVAIRQSELYFQLQTANQELERLATIDDLTQVANRRRLDAFLQQEWQRLARSQHSLSLILCDVDYFKCYNDRLGHQAGDRCLQHIAHLLSQAVGRPTDLVARYGGEEFAIVLPETDSAGALHIAQELQQAVRQALIPHPSSPIGRYLTLSVGVTSEVPAVGRSPADLLATVDTLLYVAKDRGRNQIAYKFEC